ncbi:DUF3466 family protein [Motilimonas eburnea]|uniref:DUF3466 family protein n=1 Tax=Motilimonas eburnea TaxID=1737488 RepID=UPI001E6566BD|nr:DUF3466 family protein [Motilimonas eburnea]MCE2570378.1 DUF3466 family protein [Motilimonas eburnea]
MKVKLSALSLALGLVYAAGSTAAPVNPGAYYEMEEISIERSGDFADANFGPYAVAISPDASKAAGVTTRSSINNLDYGQHFTYERECFYSTDICDLLFKGSDNPAVNTYENAIKQWRMDQNEAGERLYSSQFIPFTLSTGTEPKKEVGFDVSNSGTTDQVVTDITDDGAVVGYGSAEYSTGVPFSRDFHRHAFYKDASGAFCQLKPSTDLTRGGYSAAYHINTVTLPNGQVRTLVYGHASVNRPNDENVYLDRCFSSEQDDDRYSLNELVFCPGFNTQPWVWDVTEGCPAGELEGQAMVANPTEQWLEDPRSKRRNMQYSANVFNTDAQGIAVGYSTLPYRSGERGDRARAIYLEPDSNGVYQGSPIEITQVEQGIDDPDDNLRHTWAVDINNNGIIVGNRFFDTVKGRNYPTEFFVYNKQTKAIEFPLLDKNIRTKKERIEGSNTNKPGSNSEVSAINDAGTVVGWADAWQETQPVESGNLRRQNAFVYDIATKDAWFINDLICTQDANGKINLPYYRVEKAKDISHDGTIIATGYRYDTKEDFLSISNAKPVMLKLSRNLAAGDINDQPNCWEADEGEDLDKPFKRSGGHAFWLVALAVGFMGVRRFTKR